MPSYYYYYYRVFVIISKRAVPQCISYYRRYYYYFRGSPPSSEESRVFRVVETRARREPAHCSPRNTWTRRWFLYEVVGVFSRPSTRQTRLVIRRYIFVNIHYCNLGRTDRHFSRAFCRKAALADIHTNSLLPPCHVRFPRKRRSLSPPPSCFFLFLLYYNIIIACRVRLSRTSFVVARPVFFCLGVCFLLFRRRTIPIGFGRT